MICFICASCTIWVFAYFFTFSWEYNHNTFSPFKSREVTFFIQKANDRQGNLCLALHKYPSFPWLSWYHPMGASCIINTVIICCVLTSRTREHWTIYRGPGFLAVVWFGSTATPSLPSSLVRKLDRRHTKKTEKLRQLADRRGGKGWAWSRIIRSKESLALYKSFNILCLGQRECILYERWRTRRRFVVQERPPKFQYIDLCVRQLIVVGGAMLGWVCNSVHHSYTVKTLVTLHKPATPCIY